MKLFLNSATSFTRSSVDRFKIIRRINEWIPIL